MKHMITVNCLIISMFITNIVNAQPFNSGMFDSSVGPSLSDNRFKKFPQNEKFQLQSGQIINLPLHSTPVGLVLYGTADTKQLTDVLSGQGLNPIELVPNRGLVLVYSEDFKNASLGRYQEMTIMIAVTKKQNAAPLFINNLLGEIAMTTMFVPTVQKILSGHLPETSFYVWKMFVTSELAKQVGREVWGYPKELAQIQFNDSASTGTQMNLKADDNLCDMSWSATANFSPKLPTNASLFTTTPIEIKRTLRNILIQGESQYKLFTPSDYFKANLNTDCGLSLKKVKFSPLLWQKNTNIVQIGFH